MKQYRIMVKNRFKRLETKFGNPDTFIDTREQAELIAKNIVLNPQIEYARIEVRLVSPWEEEKRIQNDEARDY